MSSKGINLLASQQKKDNTLLLKRLRIVRFIAMGFLFVVGSTSVVLFILIAASPLPKLKQQENAALVTLNTLHPRLGKYMLIQNQLDDIGTLIKTRTYFDQTYDTITAQLPPSVQLKSFHVDKGSLTIVLEGSSLDDIDIFLKNIKKLIAEKKQFSSAILNGIATNQQSGTYSFTIDIATL